jgi:BTB/POZ domain-containing protein 9
VPKHNVATIQLSACVVEGVSRSRNALLNGDTKNYDWDSGYTCHQLGSGAIVVQLAQPYIVSSMRLEYFLFYYILHFYFIFKFCINKID